MAVVEQGWAAFIVDGANGMAAATQVAGQGLDGAIPDGAGRGFQSLLGRYGEAARHADELVASYPDLDAGHPLPDEPWFEQGASWSARRVILHIIAEKPSTPVTPTSSARRSTVRRRWAGSIGQLTRVAAGPSPGQRSPSPPRAPTSPSRSSTVTVNAECPLRRRRDGTLSAKWMQTPAQVVGSEGQAVVDARNRRTERGPPPVVPGDVGAVTLASGVPSVMKPKVATRTVLSEGDAVTVSLEPEGSSTGRYLRSMS